MVERRFTLTFVSDVLQLVEETSDSNDNDRQIVLLAAQAILQNHLFRWRQLMSSWNLYFRRLQLIAKLRQNKSVQYCLPRKSQLLMQHVYNDQLDLRKHFRVSKATFNFVCRMVHTTKDHGWPERLEVLVFLYWLATGAAYRVVAAKFGMPKSTVNDIIHRILGRFLNNMRKIIYLPREDEIESISQGFVAISESPAMNKVLGCIDCFHVGIRPPRTLEQYYVNEKMFHSIKCQFVCDHRGIVRDVFIGFPGSVHDSQVLMLSPLYSKGTFPPTGFCILGDNEYPANMDRLNVLTPFVDVTPNSAEEYFNNCHQKSWVMVNMTIVSMKARWNRVFSQFLDASNRLAPKIVAACAMMHNITLMTGDQVVIETTEVNINIDNSHHPQEHSHFRNTVLEKMLPDYTTPVVEDHDYV